MKNPNPTTVKQKSTIEGIYHGRKKKKNKLAPDNLNYEDLLINQKLPKIGGSDYVTRIPPGFSHKQATFRVAEYGNYPLIDLNHL